MKKEEILNIVESEEELNEYLNFLDNLRESGITNMFGASEYIHKQFGVSRYEARKILIYWMETFGERNE